MRKDGGMPGDISHDSEMDVTAVSSAKYGANAVHPCASSWFSLRGKQDQQVSSSKSSQLVDIY